MGLDNYPLKELSIDTALAGNNIIVPAVAGNVIRVFRLFLVLGGDTQLTFKDGPATAFDGVLDMLANGSIVFDFTDPPWFSVSAGNDFIISSSNAVQIGGRVYFTQHSL